MTTAEALAKMKTVIDDLDQLHARIVDLEDFIYSDRLRENDPDWLVRRAVDRLMHTARELEKELKHERAQA